MKNELIEKLSEIVNNLDGSNYKEGFSRIKDILSQLRGIMDAATLEEVCEVFGNDSTVVELLSNYFRSGNVSLVEGLEDYLSASISALDAKLEDAEPMTSSFTNEIPNIEINTENKESMDAKVKVENIEVADNGLAKMLVELPVQDAAKVLSAVECDKCLGSSVSDGLAQVIIDGDITADVPSVAKPVEGKIMQIIDTRSDMDINSFSVARIKSFNKYMLMFSEAVDPIMDTAVIEEELGVEAALEAPDVIPVKSTVIETNSALPAVEDVTEATTPVSYVDSEMVAPGENETVDTLNEVTSALAELPVEPASEALALVAEEVGPEAAEAIQGEVLAKAAPEVFSSFSKNSWITDVEVFAAYNVVSNYLNGHVHNFSTEVGSVLKDRFMALFSIASEAIQNFGRGVFIGRNGRRAEKLSSSLNKLDDEARSAFEGLELQARASADEIRALKKRRDKIQEEMRDLERRYGVSDKRINSGEIDPSTNKGVADYVTLGEDLKNIESKLSTRRSEFSSMLDDIEAGLKTATAPEAGNVAQAAAVSGLEKAGIGAFIKAHPFKSGIAAATLGGAGVLGGMTLEKSKAPVEGLDMYEGFSDKSEEIDAEVTEDSPVMDEAVEELLDVDNIEESAELLAEVAERVSPEIALAIQAEMCKEESPVAAELADGSVVLEEEVEEALDVIKDVKENGTTETFSDKKALNYERFLKNFAVILEDIEDEDEDEEDEEEAKGELINLDEIETESPEMDAVVKKFEELPTVHDAAVLLTEIEEEVGPEAALAVQSELLKSDSEMFKAINDEIVMDHDVVKEIYSIVNGFNPDANIESFSEHKNSRVKVYIRNFAEALSPEEKQMIVEEVKSQVMGEMLPPPPVGPEGAPVPVDALPPVPPSVPVGPDGLPLPPPHGVMPGPAPVPAPMPPVADVAATPAPELPAPPAPVEPVVVEPAPAIPPPGAMAVPPQIVNVEQPGVQIPTAPIPIDTAGVERPDIAPVVPGLMVEPPPPPAPFMEDIGAPSEVPPMSMDLPAEAVITSTTGDFAPGAVNTPKYVHLVQQTPVEQVQAQMPPVPPAVSAPIAQSPQQQMMDDLQAQKAIAEHFSRARRQVANFSQTKESAIEAYKRAMA